jgi:nitrogen fixation protein FixH
MTREFKGWHMLVITVSAFSVIIAVNLLMAYKAISTFPGLEAEDSYLASQDFDAEKAAQLALGWSLKPSYDQANGQIRLDFLDKAGKPVVLKDLTVLVGRPTESLDDKTPAFGPAPDGAYVATEALAKGKWMMHVTAHAADGTLFYQRLDFKVAG